MNSTLLVAAGCLTIIVGLVHSVLGEVLIFRRMRNGGLIPTQGSPILRERHVRILWASWHVVSVFGWALGAILLRLSSSSSEFALPAFIAYTVLVAMTAASLLVLVGTKGMHPGWVGLLGVAVLILLA